MGPTPIVIHPNSEPRARTSRCGRLPREGGPEPKSSGWTRIRQELPSCQAPQAGEARWEKKDPTQFRRGGVLAAPPRSIADLPSTIAVRTSTGRAKTHDDVRANIRTMPVQGTAQNRDSDLDHLQQFEVETGTGHRPVGAVRPLGAGLPWAIKHRHGKTRSYLCRIALAEFRSASPMLGKGQLFARLRRRLPSLRCCIWRLHVPVPHTIVRRAGTAHSAGNVRGSAESQRRPV